MWYRSMSLLRISDCRDRLDALNDELGAIMWIFENDDVIRVK